MIFTFSTLTSLRSSLSTFSHTSTSIIGVGSQAVCVSLAAFPMSRLTSPIDYSLGDTLDELLKRRTNFSTMMRLDVTVVEPVLVPSYQTRQTESVPIPRLFHLRQSRESNSSVRNHPKEVGSTFRLPPVESVTASPVEIVARNERIPIMRETTSARMLPQLSPSSPTRSFHSSPKSPLLERFSAVDASVHLKTSLEESVPTTLSKAEDGIQTIRDATESPPERFSQCMASPSSETGLEAVPVIDKYDRESLGIETYYVSSSSSTDNSTPMKRNAEAAVPKGEPLERLNNWKPPIPPKSKSEVGEADAAFSDVKTKNCLQLAVSQLRQQEASVTRLLREERTRSASFADDENTSLASDIKFTYSPVSSASFRTADFQRSPYQEHHAGCSSFTATPMTIYPSVSAHDLAFDNSTLAEHAVGTSECESRQQHDNAEAHLHSPMDVENNDQIFSDTKSPAQMDLASRSKNLSSCADSNCVNGDIEGAIAEDQTVATTVGDGMVSIATAIENLSFASSLSSKPSSEFDLEPENKRKGNKGTPPHVEWDGDRFASKEITVGANSSLYNSEASRDGRDLAQPGPEVRNKDLADSENVFFGLYNDIVYLLVHGNKQQDDNEPADAEGYDDQVSEQDSCASDRSDALDQEGDQYSKEGVPVLCFLCGHESADRLREEPKHITSQESNISAKSMKYGPTFEARDVFIESKKSSDDHSRESCPREIIDEHAIPSDFIPDEAIFDKADSEESDEAFDIEVPDQGIETIAFTPEIATAKYVDGVDEFEVSFSHHVESSKFVCWHPSMEAHRTRGWHPPFDNQHLSREVLFLKAARRLRHRPIPLHFDALRSTNVQDSSLSDKVFLAQGKADDDEIVEAIKSIQGRVEGRHLQSLAPDLARTFPRNSINEDRLPNIEQYLDGIENEHENLQGIKDLLLTESKAAISIKNVHLQPVQELGGSHNLYVELPVRNIPRPLLPPAGFSWKKELDVLTSIVNEDCCDTANDGDICLEANLSKVHSMRSITSINDLDVDSCANSVTRDATESKQRRSPGKLADEAEFFQNIGNEDTQTNRSHLLSWFSSLRISGFSNNITVSEFEEYLKQPAMNAGLDWNDIPVPDIADLLQSSETAMCHTLSKEPDKGNIAFASSVPLMHYTPLLETEPTDLQVALEKGGRATRESVVLLPLANHAPPTAKNDGENEPSHLLSAHGKSTDDAVSPLAHAEHISVLHSTTAQRIERVKDTGTAYDDSKTPLEQSSCKDKNKELIDLKGENVFDKDAIAITAQELSMDLIDFSPPDISVIEGPGDEETNEKIDLLKTKGSGVDSDMNNEAVDLMNFTDDKGIESISDTSSIYLIDLNTPGSSFAKGIVDEETKEIPIHD